ncbi:MAG: phosphonate ABC transporter, permease protein PhnE [Rhodocyclaceae bacterium]|nr:MAG: phosphonate ABC transporter, permease protein PhnE [Rhodocyclaceae bacterium]
MQAQRSIPLRDIDPAIDAVLRSGHQQRRRTRAVVSLLACAVVLLAAIGGAFDLPRYRNTLPTIAQLLGDACPPDFSRWPRWGQPLLDTLSMSVAGTCFGLLAAIPLGALAARNIAPGWLGGPLRLALNAIRSIPGLVWGIMFVAAVGFGPLPGILALASHSTGMLGKFCAEILEHVDVAPGNALRAQGVSPLGVLRFSVLPQILPRLVDVTLYRWEHNLRAATTLGVVGAGGIGLEIVTAFHLFEYREASALILLLLGLVSVINILGGRLRRHFLDGLAQP